MKICGLLPTERRDETMRKPNEAKVNRDIAKLERIIKELYAVTKGNDYINPADVNVIVHDIEDYLIEPMALSIVADSEYSEPLVMVKNNQ
jgi:hypothetical protein